MKKADLKNAIVGAASIIAKTTRNDMMIELHREYPEYGWKTNYGYGVKGHYAAIRKYGRSKHHRFIKTIMHIRKRDD